MRLLRESIGEGDQTRSGHRQRRGIGAQDRQYIDRYGTHPFSTSEKKDKFHRHFATLAERRERARVSRFKNSDHPRTGEPHSPSAPGSPSNPQLETNHQTVPASTYLTPPAAMGNSADKTRLVLLPTASDVSFPELTSIFRSMYDHSEERRELVEHLNVQLRACSTLGKDVSPSVGSLLGKVQSFQEFHELMKEFCIS